MQVQRAQSLLRTVMCRQVPKKNYHVPGPTTSYNDLPSPQGSWQTHYDAKQRKYNAHLLLGTALLTGTIVAFKASGMLYLNYSGPDSPADNISYH